MTVRSKSQKAAGAASTAAGATAPAAAPGATSGQATPPSAAELSELLRRYRERVKLEADLAAFDPSSFKASTKDWP